MCISKDCPKRKKCYRSIAKPDKFQSWGAFAFKRGKCEWFMSNKGKVK